MNKIVISSFWSLSAALLLGCGQQAESNGSAGTGNASAGAKSDGGATSGSAGAATSSTAGSTSSAGAASSAAGANTVGGAGHGGASNASAGAPGSAGASVGNGGAPGAAGASGTDVIVTIKNGDFWQDTAGNRIEAHGAGVIRVGDTWYWIGEDKSGNSGGFKAVNCYASKDLSHWEFRRAIITKQTSTDLAASDRIIERPKVIYNETTKKYVMWLHWEGQNYATAEAGVFTSDTVDGAYTQVRHFRPNDRMSRDDTLFKDDDGKAYFLSASNENKDLSLYELTDDYTNMKSQISTLWPGSYREAPAIMKAKGHYFIVNSAATNWDPNQQKFSSATSMQGPWSALANLGDSTGFDTQTAFIIPVQGSKTTTYIYAGDRWQDPDLKSSKYIWVPIKISGDTKLVMDFYESWQLNVTTGEWSAGGSTDNGGFISHEKWSLVSADSEETTAEDGHATNAFDDSTSTFWHTEYQNAKPMPPHEVVIDLGVSYSLTGMRYTPRQDDNQNGMVKDYEFYVSSDKANWGSAVKTGSFGTGKAATTVSFTAKTGRYIRFVALNEVNGKAYTAVAELDVAGTPQ
ncbi:MAG TPA: discoidin domain-containing protein [Polyangiaceae bacterium]|nr:discoidin domain-containing protein [Polyangiaceae bacterium]